MTDQEMIALVQKNTDKGTVLQISDAIIIVKEYCNVPEVLEAMEPIIRKKVNEMCEYETSSESVFDVESIKEGDTSITFKSTITKDTIYDLSDTDKKKLQKYRRLRK